jgi:hypothetical protein
VTTVGIVGSRHWTDYDAFVRAVARHVLGAQWIVSGGASGVDAMAVSYARSRGFALRVYRTRRHAADGRKWSFTEAAHARNQQIVDASDVLIACPGPQSKGTYDTIRRARKKGIPVVLIEAPV